MPRRLFFLPLSGGLVVLNFAREILHICPSRGVASYLEAEEQFNRKVLLTDEYYNGIINVRVGGSQILREALTKI